MILKADHATYTFSDLIAQLLACQLLKLRVTSLGLDKVALSHPCGRQGC